MVGLTRNLVTVSLLGTVLCACAGQNDASLRDETAVAATEQGMTADSQMDATDPGTKAKPIDVVTLKSANGNAIKFHIFKSGVLVSTEGVAGSTPVTSKIPRQLRNSEHLVDVWNLLAPDQPAPKALVDAQLRLGNASGGPSTQVAQTAQPLVVQEASTPSIELQGQSGGGEAAARRASVTTNAMSTYSLTGCNNGCCDYDWLRSTFAECGSPQVFGWQWMLFNYGWSWADSGREASAVFTLTCAATGWSHTSINIGGEGTYDFWLEEGHFNEWWWTCGWSIWGGDDTRHVKVSTNDPTMANLHTNCGGFDW